MIDLRVGNHLTTSGYTLRPLTHSQKYLIYLLRQAPYTAEELEYLTGQPRASICIDLVWMQSHGLLKRIMEIVPEVAPDVALFDRVQRSRMYGRRPERYRSDRSPGRAA